MFYKIFFSLITTIFITSVHVKAWTTHRHSVDDEGHSWDIGEPPQKIQRIHQNITVNEPSIWGITEDQLEELFSTSSDYVALTDGQYLCRVNNTWIKNLGWTLEELISRPFMELIHPEDVAASIEPANRLTSKICTINFKNRLRTKKGDYHLLEWFTLQQVSGSDRRFPGLAIAKDLTLERQIEEQAYALHQAEVATHLKSSFVAHMSHEIRTPLNGVMGFLSLALEEEISETVHDYLEQAQLSSHFLLGVANDIIDVSKIEAGALRIESVEFNPHKAIKDIISLLNPQAKKKKLELNFQIDPDLPPLLAGDENRLKQILINLVGNAIKFTPMGSVSLKVKGYAQEGNPPKFLLQVRVKDTGIGIDPEFIPNLFQPFSQEDHSMRRQFGGAGLGLYISKQLCERLGGTM